MKKINKPAPPTPGLQGRVYLTYLLVAWVMGEPAPTGAAPRGWGIGHWASSRGALPAGFLEQPALPQPWGGVCVDLRL